MILLDTNVLVHALNLDAPQHQASRMMVQAGYDGDLPVVLVPQVLLEAYAILTDPRRVAHPLPPAQAWSQIDAYRGGLPVLDFGAKVLDDLAHVVNVRVPVAQDIFDAALIAQMRAYGVTTLCTFNIEDFQGFPGISAETPETLLRRFRLPRSRRREP